MKREVVDSKASQLSTLTHHVSRITHYASRTPAPYLRPTFIDAPRTMCLAIPGQIKAFDADQQFATVDVSGVRRKVNVDLLREDGLDEDDWVLIHVGFAMSKISAAQAEEQLRLLTMLGEAAAAIEEVEGYQFDDEDDPWPSG